MKKTWPVALLLVVSLTLVWWLLRGHDQPRATAKVHSRNTSTQRPSMEQLPPPRVVKPYPAPSHRANSDNSHHEDQGAAHTSATGHDRHERDQTRAAIYRAFGRPVPERDRLNPPGTMGSTVDLPGKLDKDYINDLVREDFKPMATSCYEKALKRHPQLAGKLVVNFTIIGYQDVGGIVEGVNVMSDEGTLNDKELNKCVEDAMLSMAFDAPKEGGSINVTYPFTFAPSSKDAGTEN